MIRFFNAFTNRRPLLRRKFRGELTLKALLYRPEPESMLAKLFRQTRHVIKRT